MRGVENSEENTKKMIRLHALASSAMSLVASLVYFAPNFPFPKVIGLLALSAAVLYLLYFLFFDLISRIGIKSSAVILSQLGVLLFSASIYFTGGIVSPFIFLYFAILVSEAMYGLDNRVTLPVSLACYLAVAGIQFFGLLPNPVPWSVAVYHSPLAVFLIVVITSSYLVLTQGMSRRIISNLRGGMKDEEAEKQALLKKFSELNSTSQLGVLAHRIAHDLRGPVASISGYLQIELLKEKSEEDKRILRELEDVVGNMAESLRGITRFGRPGGGKTEHIDLPEFLDTLLAIISFSPQSSGVRFSKAASCDGRTICGSRADLQQAYFNIMKNAVEAVRDNPGEKTVELSAEVQGLDAVITVSDNGPGIVPEIMESIFKKSVTTKKDGTGVGMLITRDLLARNDASIELRNRESGGLSVVTRLPLSVS